MFIKRKDRILVLGFFGFRSNTKDGQDIKTRTLYDLLCVKMPGRVHYFDTESLRFNQLNFLILLYRVLTSGIIIYLPAQHNLKRFFTILFELTSIFRIRLCYFVVGGWLPVYIQGKHRLISRLKRIERIFVETSDMKHNMELEFGFNNVEISPNFRSHDFHPDVSVGEGPLRIVFMSRIMKLKGIEMIFQYAASADNRVVVDFFGPVSPFDQDYFNEALRSHPNTRYLGFLEPELVYTTLSGYDVLVLPTGFYTEGLPGAVIDAYISGIPVVVTNWVYASEFVVHRSTGFIVPFEDGFIQFASALDELSKNRELLFEMKRNAVEYSRHFSAEIAWESMKQIFETVEASEKTDDSNLKTDFIYKTKKIMGKNSKILVLGYFGYKTNQLDGQTVKTRMVYQLICSYPEKKVTYFDTQSVTGNRKALIDMLMKILSADAIAYLPARRNLLYVFPLLFLISILTGKRISYFVIGGWLPAFAGRNRFHRMQLRRIQNIFVETRAMEQQLAGVMKFRNVTIFPNFRFHNFIPKPEIPDGKFRIVFMSRIMKLKGVDVIFRMAEQLRINKKDSLIIIDLYGPVLSPEKEWFFNMLGGFQGFLNYKGQLQPDEIFETLSQYDVMIFPTRYPGEGCPGAIVDAYISGIPVIASDWKYNREFVEDGITGKIFDPANENEILECIHELMANPHRLRQMKEAAIMKSREYSPEIAKAILTEHGLI